MRPVEAPVPRLSPELKSIIDQARDDYGQATRLGAIEARLERQLSSPGPTPVPRQRALAARVALGALVAGGAMAAILRTQHGTVAIPASPQLSAVPHTEPQASSPPVVPTPEPAANLGAPTRSHTPTVEALPTSTPGSASAVESRRSPARSLDAVPAPPVSEVPIVQEHDLLARARKSLDSNPSDTLAMVDEHWRQFPGGALASEREFLRIMALSHLGRTQQARAARNAFVERWPNSAYRGPIDRVLGD